MSIPNDANQTPPVDNGQNTPPVVTPQPPPAAPSIPSFSELLQNKEFQSEFDRRVQQAISTARESWEQSVAEEQDEAKKLEKMTASQRESYLLQKDREAFEKDKAQFAAEQMKVACGNELLKRQLPSSFADFLSADTAEKTNERINTFEELFKNAVAEAINSQMRGEVPKDIKNTPSDPFLTGFNGGKK